MMRMNKVMLKEVIKKRIRMGMKEHQGLRTETFE